MHLRRFSVTAFILIILLGTFSCKKDFSKVSTSDWKPEIAAPFIHTTIVLNNLFANDSNLITQTDSTLVYYYHEDSVFKISADTLLDIEDDIIEEQMFSLGELYMPTFRIETHFTLNEILPYLDQQVQDTLLKYNGTEHYFPPFQLLEQATVEASVVDDFIELTFSNGMLFVDISNNLPVTLQNINFNVVDINNNFIITSISIAELHPGENQIDSTDISMLTLGNLFAFVINSFGSQGSFPNKVLIELDKGILFGFQAEDLKIINGRARISEQIMYSETNWIDLSLSPQQLYNILFSDGLFTYSLNSELNVGVNIKLKLPASVIDNNTPSQEFDILADGSVNQQWDISGMATDLTTDTTQSYNRIPIELEILILSTDNIIEFDSSDKVNGVFSIKNLNVGYADGYLGQQTISISQDTFDLNFDFMERLKGELILEEPSIKIDYVNSIGVPIKIKTEFLGLNTETGLYHYLEYDSVNIEIPTEIGDHVSGEILIDKSNSSIVDFLALRPNRIIYYGGGLSNPDGFNLNFIDDDAQLIGNAELKIPLILRANHLSFSDTLAFSGSSEDLPVEKGMIQLNILNGFPFELSMNMILADSISGNVFNKITFDNIASAIVNAEGKVTEKTPSEVIVEVDEEFLENMKIANRVLLEVETSTFGNGEVPVVLYSDYETVIAIGFIARISP